MSAVQKALPPDSSQQGRADPEAFTRRGSMGSDGDLTLSHEEEENLKATSSTHPPWNKEMKWRLLRHLLEIISEL